MADAWNAATPVVGNIVRDVTPAEFIALKQVNLDRPRAGFLGHSGFSLAMTSATGPFFTNPVPVKIPFLNTVLYKGTVAAGEYTCDQSGLYRCEMQTVNPWSSAFNMKNFILVLEKFTGGSWAIIMQSLFDCNTSGANNTVVCSSYVALTAGDKLRMSAAGLSSISQTLAAGAQGATTAFWYIEFLRSPA